MNEPFLITGLPRTRTAWFTALFNAIGVPCIHEWGYGFQYSKSAFHHWLGLNGPRGVCDPSMACATEQAETLELFAKCPVVLIERNSIDAQTAFEDWIGQPTPNYGALVRNVMEFRRGLKMVKADLFEVRYEQLDDYETIRTIVRHCCGRPLPHNVWRQFDALHIEQHLTKVRLTRQLAGYIQR